ncbi:hypothetical protein Nhal_3195 [Nitrosococcus halophilus Nc 4]|uniref:Uncharacterized protein n=1 Tax=Nitrosococcus halophilus (strain Nc4) TaxID=472759 RepID=D5BZZ9_NITHN|nr:hypothetical protein [Nitrosococcus halophilus]ADE16246.1 hypothetical protein Nhal_3195 [Nitrosococcus halophilus Nc 4]
MQHIITLIGRMLIASIFFMAGMNKIPSQTSVSPLAKLGAYLNELRGHGNLWNTVCLAAKDHRVGNRKDLGAYPRLVSLQGDC